MSLYYVPLYTHYIKKKLRTLSIEIKAKNNLYYTTTTQDKEKAQNIEHRNERASQKIDTNKINKEKAQKIEHRNHR